jgi:hypothetical protein
MILFLASACSMYEGIETLDVEHKGVKVKKDESGMCVDAEAHGQGKACVKLKKKEEAPKE